MRISDWSSDVCSSDLINATLPESPTKKAPRVRSRWGALCNESERARRPGIAQSYRALTSSGSYPGWPSKLGLPARCLGAERGLGICFCLVRHAKLNRHSAACHITILGKHGRASCRERERPYG